MLRDLKDVGLKPTRNIPSPPYSTTSSPEALSIVEGERFNHFRTDIKPAAALWFSPPPLSWDIASILRSQESSRRSPLFASPLFARCRASRGAAPSRPAPVEWRAGAPCG